MRVRCIISYMELEDSRREEKPWKPEKINMKHMSNRFGRQKKAIVSALHLPEDVVLGEMLLYFTGSRAAVVENYRSILFFSDEMLRLTGKNTRLTIKGKGLSIEYYDRDNLRVTGQIVSVEFGVL